MGHGNERAVLIYQHKSATADRQIADGLDTLLRASQPPSQSDGQGADAKERSQAEQRYQSRCGRRRPTRQRHQYTGNRWNESQQPNSAINCIRQVASVC